MTGPEAPRPGVVRIRPFGLRSTARSVVMPRRFSVASFAKSLARQEQNTCRQLPQGVRSKPGRPGRSNSRWRASGTEQRACGPCSTGTPRSPMPGLRYGWRLSRGCPRSRPIEFIRQPCCRGLCRRITCRIHGAARRRHPPLRHSEPSRWRAHRAVATVAERHRVRHLGTSSAVPAETGGPQLPNSLDESCVILAPGSTIQVTREDEHMEHLAALLSRFGSETVVAAALRAVIEQRPRSTTEVVAVDIDGRQVGVLSPTQTASFLPLVRRAESECRCVICRASLRGNSLKADVALHARKAHDSMTWNSKSSSPTTAPDTRLLDRRGRGWPGLRPTHTGSFGGPSSFG